MAELRILLIEDAEDDVLLLERTLRAGGYVPVVRRVETETAFTAALDEAAWDVVLADWTLPRFGALPALDLLRAHREELPVIVVTGTVSEETAVTAMKAGAYDVVRKDGLSRLAPAVARALSDAAERAGRRAADERYRTLARNFPNGAVILFDHDLRYVLADGAGLSDVGLSKEQLEGRTLWENFPAETAAALEPAYRAALAGATSTYDVTYGERTYEVRVLPVRDIDGHISGGMVMTQDVTAARQTAAAQRDAAEQARLRAMLVEQVNDAIISTDLAFRVESWNAAAEAIYGWRADEVIGKRLAEVIPVRRFMDGQAITDVVDALRRDGSLKGVVVHPHRDGHDLVIDSVVRMIYDAGGTPIGTVGVNRDNTARYQAEAALRRSEAYFRALTERAADLVAVVDRDGTTRYSSAALEQIIGFRPEERAGTDAFEHIHPDDLPHAQALFANVLEVGGASRTTEVRIHHRDGSWRVLETTVTNLLDDPDIAGVVVNARDITDRKRVEEQLAHDSLHDPLTGLPNRTLFLDRLQQAFERAARRPDHPCAVLFVDLDRFKTINDSLGHLVGDDLLRAVARLLASCMRAGDTVARLGGDEFAVLIEEVSTISDATAVAKRIHEALATPLRLDDHTLVVTASIGITISTPKDGRPEDLLRDADIAMYRAKHLGKARHEVFDTAMLDEALMRQRVEAELRQAIERDELVLHYQPVVAVTSGSVVGVEALVRWQHPTGGLVLPDTFIPIAEETGLIVALGSWVLREACAQAARWRAAGLPPWYIAINLAALQLRQEDLPVTLHSVLEENGVEPSALQLEVTESNAMVDPARTARVLADAFALGLHGIALDDFGTGYSSLSYLQQFPITHVKIDRSFVRDLTTNASSAALARAIIALAHTLQLTVVAEGVETADQLALLRTYGCDAAQGYLFSAPVPPDALVQLVGAAGLLVPDENVTIAASEAAAGGDIVAELQNDYLDALRAGDRERADDVIRRARDAGLSPRDIALRLVQPTAYRIGDLRDANDPRVEEEYIASAIMERQLSLLHAQVPLQEASGRTIVIGGVAGELDRIDSRIVADVFEQAGWRVVYLGVDVPIDALVTVVRRAQPDLIGLSANRAALVSVVEATIAALRRAGFGTIPVLVGGLPFTEHPERAEEVGASGTVRDVAEALDVANHLLRSPPEGGGGTGASDHAH